MNIRPVASQMEGVEKGVYIEDLSRLRRIYLSDTDRFSDYIAEEMVG